MERSFLRLDLSPSGSLEGPELPDPSQTTSHTQRGSLEAFGLRGITCGPLGPAEVS